LLDVRELGIINSQTIRLKMLYLKVEDELIGFVRSRRPHARRRHPDVQNCFTPLPLFLYPGTSWPFQQASLNFIIIIYHVMNIHANNPLVFPFQLSPKHLWKSLRSCESDLQEDPHIFEVSQCFSISSRYSGN
jgi:hypothetical protein